MTCLRRTQSGFLLITDTPVRAANPVGNNADLLFPAGCYRHFNPCIISTRSQVGTRAISSTIGLARHGFRSASRYTTGKEAVLHRASVRVVIVTSYIHSLTTVTDRLAGGIRMKVLFRVGLSILLIAA